MGLYMVLNDPAGWGLGSRVVTGGRVGGRVVGNWVGTGKSRFKVVNVAIRSAVATGEREGVCVGS